MSHTNENPPAGGADGLGNSPFFAVDSFENGSSQYSPQAKIKLSEAALEVMRRESGIRGIAYGPPTSASVSAGAARDRLEKLFGNIARNAHDAEFCIGTGDDGSAKYYGREVWRLTRDVAAEMKELGRVTGRSVQECSARLVLRPSVGLPPRPLAAVSRYPCQ